MKRSRVRAVGRDFANRSYSNSLNGFEFTSLGNPISLSSPSSCEAEWFFWADTPDVLLTPPKNPLSVTFVTGTSRTCPVFFLHRLRRKIAQAITATPPREQPIPIPAFAPVLRVDEDALCDGLFEGGLFEGLEV